MVGRGGGSLPAPLSCVSLGPSVAHARVRGDFFLDRRRIRGVLQLPRRCAPWTSLVFVALCHLCLGIAVAGSGASPLCRKEAVGPACFSASRVFCSSPLYFGPSPFHGDEFDEVRLTTIGPVEWVPVFFTSSGGQVATPRRSALIRSGRGSPRRRRRITGAARSGGVDVFRPDYQLVTCHYCAGCTRPDFMQQRQRHACWIAGQLLPAWLSVGPYRGSEDA